MCAVDRVGERRSSRGPLAGRHRPPGRRAAARAAIAASVSSADVEARWRPVSSVAGFST
jgi:hypothetical protein